MSTIVDSDFAQVPSTLGQEEPVLEDWLNELQVLDLPQLFSFKDNNTPSSDFSSEELDDFTKQVDNNAQETILSQGSIQEAQQHSAPGAIRTTSSIKNNKDLSSPIAHNQHHQHTANKKHQQVLGTISRDDLLRFTSEDLEAYVKSITTTRSLTTAEAKEIKRQRRLIKNRESAQQSRKRKKDKVGDLEAQVAELETVNDERKAKLEEIQAENVILKAEVKQLVNVIKDSPALSTLLMNVTSWMVMFTLQKAVKVQNIEKAIIPPIIQQQLQQHQPAARAVC